MSSKLQNKRILAAAIAMCLAGALVGCDETVVKNVGDYLNLRNGFLDPSQVGRFDKASPWGIWGTAKPVTWPILDQLDVVDEPPAHWINATDPTPADIVATRKEYTVGEGDQLHISVFELVTPGIDYPKDVTVNELGTINIQIIGVIHVSGLTPTQIEEKIGQLAVERGVLLPKGNGNPGPQVSVTLLQSRERVFNVIGQVGGPGIYPIMGTDFRLLSALTMAHDITGGTQPGLDYLYVIRGAQGAGVIPAPDTTTSNPNGPNPLDTMDSIEKGGAQTQPAPTRPASEGPQFLRPLPTAMVVSSDASTLMAQADLDAALGGTRPAAPAASATQPGGMPSTAPADAMLNQAVGGGTTRPGYVYMDNKWVQIDSSAAATQPAMTAAENVAAATGLTTPRVIRIPIDALLEGDPKYNIVIQPGDTIRVPNIQPGEFYMMGHVSGPGVYTLTGRKVTLKMAVAAARGLDAVAIPRRCDLIRRIGPNQEITVQVDLQRIFDGEQPDIFLKANDVINVGTDMVAPFLAVTRNAYRASYGWGFVYDRNFFIQPTAVQTSH